jgi:DNA topoisomerase-2
LTSSNYDDDQKKLTGGRNGYGAKLANIYSSEFSKLLLDCQVTQLTHIVVETADKTNSKKYKQIFSQNMTKKGTPKVRCPQTAELTADLR